MEADEYNRQQIDANITSLRDRERLRLSYWSTASDMPAGEITLYTADYQRKNGLLVDGKFGPDTQAHIRGQSDTGYVLGIDVSHHKGDIDWAAVADDPAGYMYMYTKVTQGVSFVDDRCAFNAREAARAGLRIGYYHFADPDRGPVQAQVDHFLRTIGELPSADLPHVLDVEKVSKTHDRDRYARFCEEFMRQVAPESIAGGMVYTSARKVGDGADAIISGVHMLAKYPLWSPRYNETGDEPEVATDWKQWDIWQHSESGVVDGIDSPCDLNRAKESWWKTLP